MNNLTELIIILIYLLLAAAFVTTLFTAMAFNLKAGELYRQRLAQTLHAMRLGKMLDALGIDASEYLHKQPMTEVHAHMGACAACVQTDICDSQIDQEAVSAENIGFCPNEEVLKSMQNSPRADSGSG